MKHILTKFVTCAMLVFSPMCLWAQYNAVENDSLNMADDDDIVQVAFRKVKKSDLTGGVSVVNIPELLDKNFTTYSLSNMNSLVGGFTGNLWGMDDCLILVDGVPRAANNVMSSEIEQITFLKGAQAAVLYGSRAAKGAILITTKRGISEGLTINVRANSEFNQPKGYPKYLGSAEYMSLYNEARVNDGLDPLYSATDIYNYGSGSNPYRYADVDFFSSDYLKKVYNTTNVIAEFSGGGKYASFYTNIGWATTDDLINFGQGKNNRTNRLNVRGNIDYRLNNWVTGWVNANATFYDSKGDRANYWNSSSTLRPNRVSPLIPVSFIEGSDESSMTLVNNNSNLIDGKYILGGTQLDQTNPFAAMYVAGNNKYTSRQFQFDAGINLGLEQWVKGLSFKAQIAIDYDTSYNTSIENGYATYEATWNNYSGTDLITGLTQYGKDERSGTQNISGSYSRQTIFFSGQFNYERVFNNRHNLTAMVLASGFQQSISAQYHNVCNANLGFQATYNYDNRYYVDFSGAEIHSAKLAPGHRNAFSPTASLAWRISNEDFLKGSSVVDDLKISASGGILHTDLNIDNFYMYQNIYTSTGTWWGWCDGAVEQSFDSRRGENLDLDFIKRKEVNVGVTGSFWNRLLYFDLNFFANEMNGMLTLPSTIYPNYFTTYWPESSFVPYVNYNNDRRIGFDFNVQSTKQFGPVNLQLGVVGTYIKHKASKRDENYEYEYQNRQGRPLDALFGLQSAGFFRDQEDIDNSPTQSYGTVKPGDIKYVDQNGDGVIDSKDQIYLGSGGWNGAPFTMGVHLTAKWKDFTLFALFSGNFGAKALKDNTYYWVYGDRKYSEVVRNRWTEETKDIATYPRLTTLSGDNNFQSSDFWLYKTNRFDIGKVQLSYDMPSNMLRNTFVKGFTAYVNVSNVWTFAKEREYMEMNIGSSPQCRTYGLGVTATF